LPYCCSTAARRFSILIRTAQSRRSYTPESSVRIALRRRSTIAVTMLPAQQANAHRGRVSMPCYSSWKSPDKPIGNLTIASSHGVPRVFNGCLVMDLTRSSQAIHFEVERYICTTSDIIRPECHCGDSTCIYVVLVYELSSILSKSSMSSALRRVVCFESVPKLFSLHQTCPDLSTQLSLDQTSL
jgi:hypothetical protein